MLAFAYFNSVAGQPAGRDYLSLAGPGFRDFTRIAASDPTMWRDVLLANREQVLLQAQGFREALAHLEALVRTGNAQQLEDAIAAASGTRSLWQPGVAASPD
jgi:prephenate dehydrogenase